MKELPEFEKKYKKKMEELLGHELDDTTFNELHYISLDLYDEEMYGDKEWREARRREQHRYDQYLAYLLRYDFDRVFYGHSYPYPISERLKNIWPVAQYLYTSNDASGFLGPSSAELKYVMKAIQISAMLGNKDFDDVLQQISEQPWYEFSDDIPASPEFEAWLETDEFYHMFENRELHPDLNYDKVWGPNYDKEYVKDFFEKWRQKCEEEILQHT